MEGYHNYMAKLNLDLTYLITGGAGFIGYHTAKRMLEQGARLVLADNLNAYYDLKLKQDRLEELKKTGREFTFYQLDIADQEGLEALFEKHHPDIVLNLAAQAGVRYSIDHPEEYIHANILGFFRILEACRHFGVQHLFNNMLILFLAGGVVERNLGSLRFLCLCLATGVCGNLVSVFWDAYTNAQSISVGASGMVFGVMGVILVILLRVRDRLGEGSTLGKRALLMLALSVYSGFTAGNINNAAHLGGLAAGVLLGLLWTHGRTHYDLSGLR